MIYLNARFSHRNRFLLCRRRSLDCIADHPFSLFTPILGMCSEPPPPGPTRRPFCFNCSKPARLCLCSRLRSPPLDNSIGVTILQHSAEKDHPLNSTRIAKLGLKNVAVFPVTDVNFQAQLTIRTLNNQVKPESAERQDFAAAENSTSDNSYQKVLPTIHQESILDQESVVQDLDLQVRKQNAFFLSSGSERLNFDCNGGYLSEDSDSFAVTLPKSTVTCSSRDVKILVKKNVQTKIDWVSNTLIGKAAISNGFQVKKLQRKRLKGTDEFQDFEEFDIIVPPGAALLYPSTKSISFKEVEFKVNHLIVLDGTWPKANRMYHENPWLQLLPHLKLDAREESLYAGVRQQPKMGCLSSIESIVYALKELGEDEKGLDRVLGLFDSMIEDQRRCKEENFKALTKLKEL